jgi:hypothetical protein
MQLHTLRTRTYRAYHYISQKYIIITKKLKHDIFTLLMKELRQTKQHRTLFVIDYLLFLLKQII